MKKSNSQSGFFKLRVSITLVLFSAGIFLALLGSGLFAAGEEPKAAQEHSGIQFGQSYHNDVSPALRDLPPIWPPEPPKDGEDAEAYEANLNPKLPLPFHVDVPDPVIEQVSPLKFLMPSIPTPLLNFDGVPFPGVTCNCAPPDTNGAVGLTQYVQSVNKGYQVFNKTTGASILGPTAIATVWTGFGGVCQNNTRGDPVVLYDRMANRWLISQFAGVSIPTDECIAISTTSDATGTYNRYAFNLGTNFFDYPHFGIWPDGYYMAMNIFNSAGTAFLGPQAFAFNRTAMLAGAPATFVTPGITGGPSEASFLPSDLEGSIAPPVGTANPFVSFPATGAYKVRLFHADFVTPANTTFNLLASPVAAGFTTLCSGNRNCVPQVGTTQRLDAIGDRLMNRLAYRKFADGHEAVVGNYTVSANAVAGVRWFELRAVTTAPTVFQESTYQPDTTWRWMGSAGMDQMGNLAIGFSASSATINPQIRYAGRHVSDPINTLGQGEATLFSGTGSQTGGLNRWGDYSALTIDPVDDCTFWFTTEYLATTGSFNWRTRIGSFKFATCPGGAVTPTPTPTISPGITPTPPPTPTPSPTPTPTPTVTPTPTTPTPTPTATVPPSATPTPSIPGSPTPTPTIPPPPTPTPTPATPTPTPAPPTPTPGTTPTPGVTPTPGITPTPGVTPTPGITPAPSSTPAAQALNLSTRMNVQTGENVGIGGFIITGSAPKHLLLRAIGPSVTGISNVLADPVLELHGPGGFVTILNDNWRDDPVQQAAILATGLAPTNNLEAAIDTTLNPGAYTAIVRGKNNTSGVGLIEVYDLSQAVMAKLANISTRAFVSTSGDIVIAGFILGGNSGNDRIAVRGLGPSLTAFGVTNALANPTLELRDNNGAVLFANNDWQDNAAQAAELTAAGLAPTNTLESGIAATLPPGLYTALLAGQSNGTGVGVVEVYDRGTP